MSDTDLLTLTQWLSPAFPVGGFAYSHGLEWAISEGDVSDAAGVERWLAEVLDRGAGRSDAILLCHAMSPDQDVEYVANFARSLATSRERWQETADQGAAFTATVNALTGQSDPPAALPVAVGRAARLLSVSKQQVASLYLHAFASNLVSAAVRFVPLGQTEGQRILSHLHPLIARIAAEVDDTPLDAIATSVPLADLAAMQHETQTVRIFRT